MLGQSFTARKGQGQDTNVGSGRYSRGHFLPGEGTKPRACGWGWGGCLSHQGLKMTAQQRGGGAETITEIYGFQLD